MNQGKIYAFSAAFLNASVGVFSLSIFFKGGQAEHISFYKCLTATLVLTILCLLRRQYLIQIKNLWPFKYSIALMAFFGIFLLYFFETIAYQYDSIAIVVFTLLAASTIATFVASRVFLGQLISQYQLLSMGCALIGLLLFAAQNHFSMTLGILYSAIAGIGYGIFLVLNNKFQLPTQGIPLLWFLMLYGTLFLSVPFFMNHPALPAVETIPTIVSLSLLPTIGGFYCTTKALNFASATEVQIFELVEPLIASIFALAIYHQWLNIFDALGGLLILVAIKLATIKSPKNYNSKTILGDKS